MKNIRMAAAMAVALLLGTSNLFSQFVPHYQWTLIDSEQMDEIIGEASGETAYNHCIEMAGYNRNRDAEEYATMLGEAAYVLKMLKAYGFENAKVERFENSRQQWDGIKGELWEIEPGRKKLADYDDLRAMLASGSQNADVKAELVWVEEGSAADLENLNLDGKIVVTSSSPSRVLRSAMEKGAIGAISFNNPRPLVDPLQIPWSGIGGRSGGGSGFAFMLPPREGHLLRDRLMRGEKITVHAVVESTTESLDLQVPTCVIPGTDPNADEVIFSAHLFEGYTKQGANDNVSGGAAILEIARMLKTMFDEGRLPRPERSIRFIWVPEFSGTIPWVKEHKDLMKKTLCNINLDMVGLWLSKSQSYFNLERTTFGNAHYLNDVMENYYRYVGETNRTSLVLSGRSGYINRIVAPSGSDEPFYYAIEHHYGASDHEVFNDWGVGVPAIMMITWPDLYYHTSEDRPNKLDPTQLKRCCVIGAASAYNIAAANEDMARKIAGEIVANGSHRLGIQLARALDEFDSATKENVESLYKKAIGYIEGALLNEFGTLESVKELVPGNDDFNQYIEVQKELINAVAQAQKGALEVAMKSKTADWNMKAISLKPNKLEKKAITIIPTETALVKSDGYGGYRQKMPQMSQEERRAISRGIGNTGELERLCNGKHNALQIKWMLDTQYRRESDLEAIIKYIELLEKAGLVSL